ncbi:MAG: ChaN family lipoprotein [Nitrospirae bacterium]|nr:ChaN family lipoprotein [Nitrospirota bacterium]
MLQVVFCVAIRRCEPAIRLGIVLYLLVMGIGCVPERQAVLGSSNSGEWQPWQVLETETGRVLSPSEWLKDLESYEIIYLGEEHHNKYHIEAAVRILGRLFLDGIQLTIGMEMFGWDGQSALDDYVSNGQAGKNEFLEQVRWKQNWGGAFEDYEPLVTFARDRQLSIRAMNPPKPLIRRVGKLGLEQVRQESEWAFWGMQQEEIVDDPAYRTRILDQLRRCHGGGTEQDYRTMYEASMVRDEGMAKTLVARLKELRRDKIGSRSVIVSYTGGGHIQYNLPVPMRVARRLAGQVKQTTIYLTSFEAGRTSDIQDLMQEHVADYIWLTPMGRQGPPQRCR